MRACIKAGVSLVGALLLVAPARGEDWPMFGRDQSRNAVSSEKGAPLRWQIERRDEQGFLVRPSWNVKWEADLGSQAFASPVVAGGLIWIGTNNAQSRDPRLKDVDASVLMCFRERDGKFLWQYASPRLGNRHQDWEQAGLNCSPLANGDRLWFTTNRCEVVCLDIGPLRQGTGEPKQLWKLDMRKDLGVSPRGQGMGPGYTCSIAAPYQGRIYVTTANGVGEDFVTVPAPQAPSLLCLDMDTGKVLWSDNSPGKNILYGQWSSPLVAEVRGKCQVIAAQGDGWVRSFEPLSGKLIWEFDCNPKDSTWVLGGRGTRNEIIGTPVLYRDRVYLCVGQDLEHGEGPGHLWCIDTTKHGDVSPELVLDAAGKVVPHRRVQAATEKDRVVPNPNSAAVWHYGKYDQNGDGKIDFEEEFHRSTGTVVIKDDLLYLADFSGLFHCVDAKTGKPHWTYDMLAASCGSALVVDDKVYIGNEDGAVAVFDHSADKNKATRRVADEYKPIAEISMGTSVYSSPVFANGVLYVATRSTLYALKLGGGDGRVTDRAPGHWPQWRGADRTNVSEETGLLKEWPKEGPPLAWKAQGLGEGVASVAVAGGRVYTLGYVGENEHVTALDETTGKQVWTARIGPALKDNPVMRWLSQRTPTVDEDRLYAVTAGGELICLTARDGQELWRKNYVQDFEGARGIWGYCDRPLVDGDRLICTPGGAAATVVALNKKTGAVIWKGLVPDGDRADYSTTVVAQVGNVRQYVVFLHGAVAGFAARDGKLLWRYDKVANATANNHSPVVRGDQVFCGSGYGSGIALLKLVAEKEGTRAEEVYFRKQSLPPWHDSMLLVGEHVFAGTGSTLACLELKTGNLVWQDRGTLGGRLSVTCADGYLYLRSQAGQVALVEASPKAYVQRGFLPIPGAVAKGGSTAPVVTGGRLYLRDDDLLFCYDVKEGALAATDERLPLFAPDPRPTRPRLKEGQRGHDIFVTTPQDVVDKMLQLAKVKRGDTVYDLGCGDGRIVVTAAQTYGCKAVGYDIDPECVKLSRDNVKKHDVGRLVTIEQKDIFGLDLSGADVIALYLLPRTTERLLPQLKQLKPGSRIVSHQFEIPGLRPDHVVTYVSKEDDLPHKVYLWTTPVAHVADKEEPAELRRMEGHSAAVWSVAISPDGHHAVSASADKTLCVWDIEKGKLVRTIEGHSAGIWSVAISPDGRRALSGGDDGTVRLWDLETGKEIRQFEASDGRVRGVAFSRDGRRAAACGLSTVRLWDVESGKELSRLEGHTGQVHAVAYSPDNRFVLSGDGDASTDDSGIVRLWDVDSGKEVSTFTSHKGSISAVAFSPDGRRILSASHDQTVRLWDRETGKELRDLEGHTGWVEGVTFSPDSTRALSCGKDGTVRLWDLATGKELHRFEAAHADGALTVAFSLDGRSAISGGSDKVVRLWKLPK